MSSGYVHTCYLIWAVGTDKYKIGYSISPKVRLQALQTGSFAKLKLIKTFETLLPREDEIYLHWLMDKYRIHGEWFQLPKTVTKNLSWFKSFSNEEKDCSAITKLMEGELDNELDNELNSVNLDNAIYILESLGVDPDDFYLQCTLNECHDNKLLQSALDFIVEDAREIHYEYPVDHAIHIIYSVAIKPDSMI